MVNHKKLGWKRLSQTIKGKLEKFSINFLRCANSDGSLSNPFSIPGFSLIFIGLESEWVDHYYLVN